MPRGLAENAWSLKILSPLQTKLKSGGFLVKEPFAEKTTSFKSKCEPCHVLWSLLATFSSLESLLGQIMASHTSLKKKL